MLHGTLHRDDVDVPATTEDVLAVLSGHDFFWLDLEVEPGADAGPDDTVSQLLLTDFGFHPLAVRSALRFSQRPRLDQYDGFSYLVVRGADPDKDGSGEVHCFVTDRYVVTVHKADCPVLKQVREQLERHPIRHAASPVIEVLYHVVGSLVDSFFPFLSDFDDRIDALEDQILQAPTEAQLGDIFSMKRTLIDVRKVVAPQRDMMASINAGVTEVPGLTTEAGHYFRDLYDHMIRLTDLVDSYRDLLSNVMDTHLSTVSNRLNVVMKQLTIIATIFLPLSFLTGFFGQNFAYLVRGIGGPWAFYVFGLGLDVAAVVFLLVLFRRRGWLGGPTV